MRAAPCQKQPDPSGCLEQWNRGCGWLRICGNSASFRRDLHPQVVDLLDWPQGQMKFETRHSPHTFFAE